MKSIGKNCQGFSLFELLLVTALSLVLLLGLSSLLINVFMSYQDQQSFQSLYDQASFIAHVWHNDFAAAGDLGCQHFQQKAQIINFTSMPVSTDAGVKVYQVGRDTLPDLLPKAVLKKLLPQSIVIVEEHADPPFMFMQYDSPQQLSVTNAVLQKHDLILLSSCQHAWLFWAEDVYQRHQRTYLTPPVKLPVDEGYRLAKWQTTYWFAMKNEQQGYGIYRLNLPTETTPVELIRDVQIFQAKALVAPERFVPAEASLAWPAIHLLRITLVLQNKRARLTWPMSFAFTKPALGWREI